MKILEKITGSFNNGVDESNLEAERKFGFVTEVLKYEKGKDNPKSKVADFFQKTYNSLLNRLKSNPETMERFQREYNELCERIKLIPSPKGIIENISYALGYKINNLLR